MKLHIRHILTTTALTLLSVQAGPLDNIGMPFGINQRFNNIANQVKKIDINQYANACRDTISNTSQQAVNQMGHYAHTSHNWMQQHPVITAHAGLLPAVEYLKSVATEENNCFEYSGKYTNEALAYSTVGAASGAAASYMYGTNPLYSIIAGVWTGCVTHSLKQWMCRRNHRIMYVPLQHATYKSHHDKSSEHKGYFFAPSSSDGNLCENLCDETPKANHTRCKDEKGNNIASFYICSYLLHGEFYNDVRRKVADGCNYSFRQNQQDKDYYDNNGAWIESNKVVNYVNGKSINPDAKQQIIEFTKDAETNRNKQLEKDEKNLKSCFKEQWLTYYVPLSQAISETWNKLFSKS